MLSLECCTESSDPARKRFSASVSQQKHSAFVCVHLQGVPLFCVVNLQHRFLDSYGCSQEARARGLILRWTSVKLSDVGLPAVASISSCTFMFDVNFSLMPISPEFQSGVNFLCFSSHSCKIVWRLSGREFFFLRCVPISSSRTERI